MKFLLCLAVIAIVGAYALTEEQRNKVNKVAKECKEEIGTSEENVPQINKGILKEDDKFKAIVLCVTKKHHLANEDGEIDVEALKAKLKRVAENDEEVDKIVDLCVIKKDTPEDTAYHLYKCLRENKPNFSPVD